MEFFHPAARHISTSGVPCLYALLVDADLVLWAVNFFTSIPAASNVEVNHRRMVDIETGSKGLVNAMNSLLVLRFSSVRFI